MTEFGATPYLLSGVIPGLDPGIQVSLRFGMAGFVYILTNKRNGTLYTGVTADIARRMDEHRHRPEGFVAQYGLSQLVFYETHPRIEDAIQRETSIKRWPRKWKLKLIEELNPEWRDLIEELNQ